MKTFGSNDDVEETQLSNSFDDTCHVWEVRQGCIYGLRLCS